MEVVVALGEPVVTFLFAVSALVHLASTSAVSIRLVTVGTIITEASVMRAILPADGTNTCVAFLAEWVAKCTIFLLVVGAGVEWLTGRPTVGFLPAGVRYVSVVVVMVEVMNRCTVVILLCMRERLLGVVSEVRDVLFALVGAVSSMVRHWINIDTVKSTVSERLVIEVLRIVVDVMVVAVLQLTKLVVALQVAIVVVRESLAVVHDVMLSVKSLNVMVIHNVNMLRLVRVVDMFRGNMVGHHIEVRIIVQYCSLNLVFLLLLFLRSCLRLGGLGLLLGCWVGFRAVVLCVGMALVVHIGPPRVS